MDIASFVLAVIAVVVAGLSAVYSRRQAASSREQAVEAKRVAAIEQRRFHADLTPEIELMCKARDRSGTRAEVTLELTGPAGLDGLDEVRVRLRDDQPRKPTPGSLQAEQHWDEVIWGPYRIKSGLRDTDPYGREHGPFPLPKNEPYPIPLEHSFVPPWQQDSQSWRDQYQSAPVRLEITCIREGQQSWVLTPEIKVYFAPEMFVY